LLHVKHIKRHYFTLQQKYIVTLIKREYWINCVLAPVFLSPVRINYYSVRTDFMGLITCTELKGHWLCLF